MLENAIENHSAGVLGRIVPWSQTRKNLYTLCREYGNGDFITNFGGYRFE